MADLNLNMPEANVQLNQLQPEQFVTNSECPQVEIVNELSVLSDFTNISRPNEDNLITRVFLQPQSYSCDFRGKSVTVDLQMGFQAMLGPRGRVRASDKPFFSFPFFVAVTSPSGNILAKEVFGASVTFEAGEDQHQYVEKLRQIIPISSRESGKNHKVLIGFQLTQDQLNYNRKVIAADAARQKEEAKQAKKAQIMLAPEESSSAGPTGPASIPAAPETGAPVNLTGQ